MNKNRNKLIFRSTISAVVALSVFLSLTGCGKELTEPSSSVSPADTITDNTTTTVISTTAESDVTGDATTATEKSGTVSTTKGHAKTTRPAGYPIALAVKKTLTPLYAGEEVVLNTNPDRGFRLQVDSDIGRIAVNKNYEGMKSDARVLIEEQLDGMEETVTLVQFYMYLSSFNDRDITEKGLMAIEACLDTIQEMGLKANLRFAYAKEMNDGLTDAPQNIIMRHIEQLAPIVAKWKSTIYVLEAGFIGAWGEWHSEYYPLDREAILRKIVNVLLPSDMYLQVRLPEYKNLIPKSHPAYKRIGVHNDSIFGKLDYPTDGNGDRFYSGTDQWNQLIKESAYAPSGGELYWSGWNVDNDNFMCEAYPALLNFSEHRYSSLSILHGYYDYTMVVNMVGGDKDTRAMGLWKKVPVTKTWLEANGVIGNPHFFEKADGSTVSRNVFDFIMSHLGYQVEAQEVTVTGSGKPGDSLKVTMPIVNYGFAAAFNLKSGFAILDENNKPVTSVAAGDPATWYNRNPDNYSDAKLLSYTLSATMKVPKKTGRYKLAFYLKNSRGDGARLANGIDFVNGYNILHVFDV